MSKVIIQIETKGRELYGKIWLSLHLLSMGHDVILGDKRIIQKKICELDPDFFLSHRATDSKSRLETFKILQKHGVAIGVLETEGAIFNSIEDYVDRVYAEGLANVDCYFSWGETQTQHLREKYWPHQEKIVTTGNPRFDLLREPVNRIYKTNTDLIESSKPYILIPTSFGKANHFSGNSSSDLTQISAEREMITQLLESIKAVSTKVDEFDYIIRPHPSEGSQIYTNTFSNSENVSVVYDENPREWIYNAEAIIQNGSTTAIESVLMGIPSIAYDPVEQYNPQPLPNEVSYSVTTANELVDVLTEILNEPVGLHKKLNDLSLLTSWFHIDETKFAAEYIADHIDQMIQTKTKSTPISENKRLPQKVKNTVQSFPYKTYSKPLFANNTKILQKVATPIGVENQPSISGLRFQKLPGIEPKEIQNIAQLFRPYKSYPPFTIERVSNWADLYRLSPEN